MNWTGIPADFNSEDWVGFVYIITNTITGQYYIGKKFMWKKIKSPPLKGKKRKRSKIQEADWREYNGSCNQLLADILTHGDSSFTKHIVSFHKTRWETSYNEAKLLFNHNVLFDRLSYNGIMNIRLRKFEKFCK